VSVIAFFDVDKTILSVNSANLWLRRELREGTITRFQMLRASFWVGLYHLGYVRMEHVIDAAVAHLEGKSERDVIERTLRFYDEEVAATVKPMARAAIEKHQSDGDLVFLLTSSSNYLSAPLSDLLKVDGFLANRFEVDGGRFTGKAVHPLCFGRGKIAHAQTIADKVNIPLESCAFYTDSISDLPLMEVVKTPVAVDPDARLRRHALKRGWRVEYWMPPTKALPPATTK